MQWTQTLSLLDLNWVSKEPCGKTVVWVICEWFKKKRGGGEFCVYIIYTIWCGVKLQVANLVCDSFGHFFNPPPPQPPPHPHCANLGICRYSQLFISCGSFLKNGNRKCILLCVSIDCPAWNGWVFDCYFKHDLAFTLVAGLCCKVLCDSGLYLF